MRYGLAMTRREFLAAGTALGGTLVLGGRQARVWAANAVSAPPSVDRLAVRVVVDGYYDALVVSRKVGNVEVQRVGLSAMSLDKPIHSEYGLSLHLESERGAEKRNFLLDFGFSRGRY